MPPCEILDFLKATTPFFLIDTSNLVTPAFKSKAFFLSFLCIFLGDGNRRINLAVALSIASDSCCICYQKLDGQNF